MTGGFKRYSPVQANYKNKFIMEKRVLAVKTAQQAFALMKSMLVANMVDNELVEKIEKLEMRPLPETFMMTMLRPGII